MLFFSKKKKGQEKQRVEKNKELSAQLDFLLLELVEEEESIELQFDQSSKLTSSVIKNIRTEGEQKILSIPILSSSHDQEALERSETVTVFFYNTGGVAYAFQSKFLKRVKNEEVSILAYPKLIEFFRRRHYFRIEPSEENPLRISFSRGKDTIEAIVNDISGGGLSFFLEDDILRQGTAINAISLFLPGVSKRIIISGEIVKIIHQESAIKYSLEFIGLKEKTRQSILSYIFTRQRIIARKKGVE